MVSISITVAQTSINYIIFLKSVMGTFKCRFGNSFDRLRFLPAARAKLQKMYFFEQIKDHNLRKKYGN